MRMLLAATALLASFAARAEPELAVRLGVAVPTGEAVPGVSVSDTVRTQFPVQLDALWRFGPLAAGGYGSWGLGRAPCDPGASCGASVWRAGLQATWSFMSGRGAEAVPRAARSIEPWVGLAAGYEWTVRRRSQAGSEVTTTLRGFELLALQAGLDWRLARRVWVGPAVLVGFGRYSHVSVDTPVDSASVPLDARSTHTWIHAALRVRVPLGTEVR